MKLVGVFGRPSGTFTSFAEEVMFSVAFFLFICYQHYSKSYERVAMTIYGGVLGGKGNK